jgi:nitroreductase
MDMLAAIHQRFSVRSYANRSVDPALLERLMSFAESAGHVSDEPSRVDLASGVNEVKRVLTFMLGSYGLVQNAPHLLVGILPEESEGARVDLGYVLEQVVLEATRLSLGTCWITGSYDAERAGDAVTLGPQEVAAAVCALGHPTEEGLGRLHTQLIRRLAGGHKRKPLSKIVFSEHWGEAWSPDEGDPSLVTVLKHARLAPSAHNAQPWRFILRPERLVLVVVKPRFIDAGIVMSHVTLAAEEAEARGRWDLQLRDEGLADTCKLPDKAIPVATFRLDLT